MIPILLALAISWGSYADAQHTVQCDSFSQSHAPVYCWGQGYAKNTWYMVRWTDGDGQIVLTEVTKSTGKGELASSHAIGDTDAPGTWYARVYLQAGNSLVATDSFEVLDSAIPEFPSVLAALLVVAICGFI